MTDAQKKYVMIFVAVLSVLAVWYLLLSMKFGMVEYQSGETPIVEATTTSELVAKKEEAIPGWPLKLDTVQYDKRLLALAGYVPPKPVTVVVPPSATNNATTTRVETPPSPLVYSSSTNVTVKGKQWPSEAVYPNGGSIIPFKRILAYYGNFFSRHMGILGEYEPEEVLRRLAATQKLWEEADLDTPVQPAIEYIAMVAQADGGADGMYRAMMPAVEIEKAYALAKKADAILILDLQIGLSPIERELPKFKTYLERPEVHLALDPEFSMKTGDKPGTVIGTHSAADINYVIKYMSEIVRTNKLPPKVLLVHRFTQNMVTNSASITPTPEVQVIVVMDGWGPKDLKRGTYQQVIVPEPVQFAGIKLFYKNDLKAPSTGLLTPADVLNLHPKPIYIQYQ